MLWSENPSLIEPPSWVAGCAHAVWSRASGVAPITLSLRFTGDALSSLRSSSASAAAPLVRTVPSSSVSSSSAGVASPLASMGVASPLASVGVAPPVGVASNGEAGPSPESRMSTSAEVARGGSGSNGAAAAPTLSADATARFSFDAKPSAFAAVAAPFLPCSSGSSGGRLLGLAESSRPVRVIATEPGRAAALPNVPPPLGRSVEAGALYEATEQAVRGGSPRPVLARPKVAPPLLGVRLEPMAEYECTAGPAVAGGFTSGALPKVADARRSVESEVL
mmetsp:Transcript_10053/g.25962  ORF Transcript_10053/g.25962 Transcript_10053/m.25962 type:complete len:279 (+) Transcript_10053:224-1060(+)